MSEHAESTGRRYELGDDLVTLEELKEYTANEQAALGAACTNCGTSHGDDVFCITEHVAACRYCGREVVWTTANWEPAETEAPIDASGNYCCDRCAQRECEGA
jgi:hypothetical protein